MYTKQILINLVIKNISVLLFSFISPILLAQVSQQETNFGIKTNDIYRVLSPKPDSTVKNGELFICIVYAKNVELNVSSIKLYLDGRLLSANLRVQNHKITVLYTETLRKGEHKVLMEAKEKGYTWLQPLKWKFYIDDLKTPIEDSSEKAYKRQVELTGSFSADYRKVNLTGPGRDARQEPPYTQTTNLNMNLRVGKVMFPIRAFQTSDEQNYNVKGMQSRNYFSIGMETKRIELNIGDQNMNFDKLVLTGTRLRGAKFAYKSKRFKMTLVNGYSQRAIEGEIAKYNGVGFPPTNMRLDSTYVLQGTGNFQRNVSAVRFAWGSKTEGQTIGISILKSKDDSNSIKNGYAPKENLVVGLDQTFSTNESRMKGQVGAAMSIITNNISDGPVTQLEFEKRLNTELIADPYKFRKIQTINYSTVIPGKSSLAAYLNFQFKRKNNQFTIDYKYFGAGYQSFGNPFVRTDIQAASVQDMLYLWKRRVTINAKYTFQSNNLSNTAYSTVYQHLVTGNMSFVYSPKAPQFILNYNMQARKSIDNKYKTLGANDQNSSVNAMVLYNLKTKGIQHSINITYTTVFRVDKIYTQNDNHMNIYSAGLREQFIKLNTTLDFQYSKTELIDLNGYTPINQSFDARLKYQSKKLKTYFGIGYTRSEMLLERFGSSKSHRNIYSFIMNMQMNKKMQLDIEASALPYIGTINTNLNYNEINIYARFTYLISSFLRK